MNDKELEKEIRSLKELITELTDLIKELIKPVLDDDIELIYEYMDDDLNSVYSGNYTNDTFDELMPYVIRLRTLANLEPSINIRLIDIARMLEYAQQKSSRREQRFIR